ncbi:phage tail tape measure protein [Lentilactobacillus sp. SPB1-3]|uniref:Phage tail tape measure protein n=1 Tax=Lentilactobacillus terminaliae TaxID=3003483 RepID=A0ACD5DCW3_9LACO
MALEGTLQNTIKLPVRVNLRDLRAANKLIQKINSNADKLIKPLENVSKQFDSLSKNSKEFSEKYQRDIKQATTATKDLNKSVAKTSKAVDDRSSSVEKNNEVVKRSTNEVEASQSRLGRRVQQSTRHVKASGSAMKSIGDKMASVGKAASVVSLGIGAGFLYSAKEASRLQHEFNVIKNLAVTSGEKQAEAQKNVNAMQRDGVKLSEKYGVSQTEIAKGYEELVRRGYTTNQALGSQKTYLEGAKASGDSYTDVVNNAASALEQFNMKSKSVTGMAKATKLAVNQMAYSADKTATSFSDLGEAMKFAGPDAHAAHQSFHETVAAIGQLSNFGIDGSQAGTSLRQIYQRLINPPSKGKAPNAMKSMGLDYKDFRDAKNELLPIQDIFAKLDAHMKGMSHTDKGGIYAALFGANASSAAQALGSSYKQLKQLDGEVQHAQDQAHGHGYVEQLAQKNMKDFKSQLERLKTSSVAVGTELAKTILPAATKILDKVAGILVKFNSMPAPLKKTVAYGSILAGLFGPALIGAGKLLSAISTIKGAMGGLAGASKGTTALTEDVANTSGGEATRTSLTASRTTSVMSKVAKGAIFADAGFSAFKAFRDGLDSKKGGAEIWDAGGKAVGGSIGLALGGPVGAAAGTAIGGKIADVVAGSKLVRDINASEKANIAKNGKVNNPVTTGTVTHTKSKRGTADVYSTGLVTPDSQATNTSKSGKKAKPFDKLPKDAKQAMSQVESVFSASNKRIVANSSTDLYTANRKVAKQDAGTFATLNKQLASYTSNRSKTSKNNLNLLVKNGDLTRKQAKTALATQKIGDKGRLEDAQKAVKAIVKAEKNGGEGREKAIATANQKIAKLLSHNNNGTSKYAAKQKIILGKLNDSTKKLSAKQGQAVVQDSYKTMNKQISYANKTYKSAKSSADKKYKATMNAADHEYYVTGTISKKQYNSIKSKAEKTRDKAVSAANDRKNKTIDKAKTEHQQVVSEATKQTKGHLKQVNKETGESISAFEKMGNAISGVFSGIGHAWDVMMSHLKTPSKKQMDHIVGTTTKGATDNAKFLNNFGNGKGGKSKPKSKPSSVGPYNGSLKVAGGFGHASGGAIRKTHVAMVGEGGEELAIDKRTGKFRLLGANGPMMAVVKAGEHILNARDTAKVKSGGLGKGMTLPGYAKGTASLKKQTQRQSKGKAETYTYNISNKGITNASKMTKKSMKQISKSIVGGYTTSNKGSSKQMKSMQKNSNSTMKSIMNGTKKYSQKTQTNTVGDYDDMQKGAKKQMDQMQKDMHNGASDIVSDFAKIFGKLDNYAHAGMANAIKQINAGFRGINSAFGQFGNGSVLTPIKYAKGSNGKIPNNQIAMLNDSPVGPRQEAIVRNNGQIELPQGDNTVQMLQRGDAVLNGYQTKELADRGVIQHYAKGSGVSKSALEKIAASKAADPAKAWGNDFAGKIGSIGTKFANNVAKGVKAGGGKSGKPYYLAAWNVINDIVSQGSGGAGGTREAFLKYAEEHYTGKPYNMGSMGPTYYDCSAMVASALKHFGVDIGRTTVDMQTSAGVQSRGHDLKNTVPGDIVVFGHGGGAAGHVGIIKNPKTGSMFNETPPRARVTSIAADKGMGYEYFRVKGLHDAAKKKSNGSKPSKRLEKLFKHQFGKKALGKLESKFSDDSIGDLGSMNLAGDIGTRARQLAAAIKKAYPSATNAGIAAVLGNWKFESQLNPGAVNSGGGASGLGQWLGGRKANLIRFAQKQGKSWRNAGVQLEFALSHDGSDSNVLRSVLRGKGSVASLAAKFSTDWERGGYTQQHVNGARSIIAALHANGGWAEKGKVNVFGEVPGQPEVAINPKKPSADHLIAETIQARAKESSSSPFAGVMDSLKAKKQRKSLRSKLSKLSSDKSSQLSSFMPKVEVHNTFNIQGKVDDDALDAISTRNEKSIENVMNKLFRQVYDKMEMGDA